MTQPTEQDRHEFDPTPAGDYGTLLVQFKGLLRLYNSEAATRSEMSRTIMDLRKRLVDGANDSVNSQRAANARLTDEVERLQARVAELEKREAAYDIILKVVSNALERAGVAECDNPADAIEMIAKERDGLAAKLEKAEESLSGWREGCTGKALAKLKADAVREACDKVVSNYRMVSFDKNETLYLNVAALRDYANQIEREGGV